MTAEPKRFTPGLNDSAMMKTLAALALLALAACANAAWVKEGADQQDFSTDSYSCEKDTRQSGYFGGGLVGAANMQGFFNKCMVAHGWHLENTSATSITTIAPASFTQEQWNAGRRQCQEQAQSAGDGFANVFDQCMKQHGL